MLHQLQKKKQEASIVQGDVRYLPFASETFNVVTSSFMLLHLTADEKQQVFRQVRRVLVSGGRCGCLTGQERTTDAYPRPGQWRAWLTGLGFSDVKVTDFGGIYRMVTAQSGRRGAFEV